MNDGSSKGGRASQGETREYQYIERDHEFYRKAPQGKTIRNKKRATGIGAFRSSSNVLRIKEDEDEGEDFFFERQVRRSKESRIDYAIKMNENPGPGKYNVAGNILKKSLNAKAGKGVILLRKHVVQQPMAVSQTNFLPLLKKESSLRTLTKRNESLQKLSRPEGEESAYLEEIRSKDRSSYLLNELSRKKKLSPEEKMKYLIKNSESQMEPTQKVKEFKMIKLSKQGKDNTNFDSSTKIKSKEIGDMTNLYQINKFFLSKYNQMEHNNK